MDPIPDGYITLKTAREMFEQRALSRIPDQPPADPAARLAWDTEREKAFDKSFGDLVKAFESGRLKAKVWEPRSNVLCVLQAKDFQQGDPHWIFLSDDIWAFGYQDLYRHQGRTPFVREGDFLDFIGEAFPTTDIAESSPRTPRKVKPIIAARIREIVAAAESRWANAASRPDRNQMARLLAQDAKFGLGESAIRQILSGTYKPMVTAQIRAPFR